MISGSTNDWESLDKFPYASAHWRDHLQEWTDHLKRLLECLPTKRNLVEFELLAYDYARAKLAAHDRAEFIAVSGRVWRNAYDAPGPVNSYVDPIPDKIKDAELRMQKEFQPLHKKLRDQQAVFVAILNVGYFDDLSNLRYVLQQLEQDTSFPRAVFAEYGEVLRRLHDGHKPFQHRHYKLLKMLPYDPERIFESNFDIKRDALAVVKSQEAAYRSEP
jgi:hypothetical protein